MKIKHLFMAAGVVLTILGTFACGSAATPEPSTSTPAATSPADDSPQAPFASSVVGTPVPRSDVETTFDKPLSSGLSVADVAENALPSVVHIIAGSGTGTGFIINEGGLVVTNKHVVEGSSQVAVRLVNGNEYQGNVTQRHPDLDLAYIEIDATLSFTPIAIGDSDEIRVGEDVIAIGFPLGRSLGLEPTVSVGIISAKRENHLQTDASLNPGNSGGPLLDMFGQVAGVIVSRVETDDSGRPVSGIGFAIPINAVKASLGEQVSPAGTVLSTPTPFPTIGPTPDLEATKAAIDAIDAHRRQVEQATRTAIEAQEEANRYAASLEATRIAELPTPSPTPTPHPATFCREWEALVLEWIKEGNYYWIGRGWRTHTSRGVPSLSKISAQQGHAHCVLDFPSGVIRPPRSPGGMIGDGRGEYLPGRYQYRRTGDDRVKGAYCYISINGGEENRSEINLAPGEPFEFTFYRYHGKVSFSAGGGCRVPNAVLMVPSTVSETRWTLLTSIIATVDTVYGYLNQRDSVRSEPRYIDIRRPTPYEDWMAMQNLVFQRSSSRPGQYRVSAPTLK